MNWTAHLNETALHYAAMYQTPGFRGHALNRLHHLDESGMYAGLLDLVPQEVRAELQRLRARRNRDPGI